MTLLQTEKKKHAKFSASGSERWLNCPGSVRLSEKVSSSPDNKYSIEGTDAHSVLEMIAKNKNPRVTAMMLKKSFPETMVDHGLRTFHHIQSLVPQGAELLCETEVRLDFVEPGMFGTTDFGIIELFGILWVIDYKYGAGRLVDPKENTQMIYYGLGLAHKYHFNFDGVRLAVAQPRIVHKEGFFRTWDMEVPALKEWEYRFKEGVEKCKDPFAELHEGRWCFFCPAQSICPLIEGKQFEKAQNAFDDNYVETV